MPVLIVDDDANDRELILRSFDAFRRDHRLFAVENGEEALNFIFRKGKFEGAAKKLPYLVLLDIKMPKVDGFQVLRTIRSNDVSRYIPVVVLTSSNMEEDIARAYELGANAYVVKPISFPEFKEALRIIGAMWFKYNTSLVKA